MITIRCLVEDTALPGTDFRAEHGIAWHIETPQGTVLFDTGASGDVLLHNAALLDVDLAQIDALVLSHAHYDHTGGLAAVLERTRPDLPLYAHADLFRPRYKTTDDGQKFIGIAHDRADLAAQCDLRLSASAVEVLPGLWTTGGIVDRQAFVGGSPNLIVPDNGDGWRPDPYEDDLSLLLHTAEGVVVLLGCGHAGLLNILRRVKRHTSRPIHTVAGGTHLISATPPMLSQAVAALQTEYDTPRVYPNHCTGSQAFGTLHDALDEHIQPCPAGTVLRFESA